MGSHRSLCNVPHLPLAIVIGTGIALEIAWLSAGLISAWITDVPSFTASMAPDRWVPWAWWHAAVEAWLGPDRTGIAPPPPSGAAQLAFLWSLGLACVLYVLALIGLRRVRRVTPSLTWLVIGFAALFVATTAWTPGVLSGDVILYATIGRLAGVHGLDPHVPSTGWATFASTDTTWWWYDPTTYGPAFTGLSVGLARMTQSLSPLLQVLTFKLLAVLAFSGTLALIWWLTPRLATPPLSPNDRLMALAIFGWNPLVVLESGQGHNDLLMALLLLLSLVPLVTRRTNWPGSFGVLTIDTLIKYLPAVTGVFLFVLRLRQRRSVNGLLAAVATVGVLALALILPWGDPGAVLGIIAGAARGGQRYANSLVDVPSFPIVARYLDKLSEHIDESLALVRFWEQVVVRSVMVVYVAWEIRRIWRSGAGAFQPALVVTLGASLRVMLLIVIFVLTQTLDYYFISPLALAAALGWKYVWTRVAVAISVLFLPTFYMRRMELEPIPNLFLAVALVGPLLAGLVASLRASR